MVGIRESKRVSCDIFTSFVKMDFQILFQHQLNQINKLDNFIVFYGRKEEIVADLREIFGETEKLKDLLLSCMEFLKIFRTENNHKCKNLIAITQHQQFTMLNLLEKVMNAGNNNPTALTEITNTPPTCKLPPFKSGEQSIMTLAEYMKSPYATKRMRPLSLQFIDFERTINIDDFSRIPGYIIF